MDALKKAEQEKQAASKHVQEMTGEISEADEVDQKKLGGTDNDTPALRMDTTGDSGSSDVMLSVELEDRPDQGQEQSNVAGPLALEDHVHEAGVSTQRVVAENGVSEDPIVVADLQFEEEPDDHQGFDDREIDGDVFDDMSGKSEDSGARISALELAGDIGRGGPTPVSAQTVFVAGSSTSDRRVPRWFVVFSLCLVCVGLLAFFILKNTMQPVVHVIRSPSIDGEIGTPSAVVDVHEGGSVSDIVDDASMTDQQAEEGELRFFNDTDDGDIAMGSVPLSEEPENTSLKTDDAGVTNQQVSALEDNGPADPSEPSATVTKTDDADVTNQQVSAPEDNGLADPAEPSATVTDFSGDPEPLIDPINIHHAKAVDSGDSLINIAYQHYIAGDYEAAEEGYHEILQASSKNRNALLGLAVIFEKRGNIRQAYSYYLKVLEYHPGDSIAEAALINFQQHGDHLENENILKILLKKQPGNPFLYYSLGYLYALQQRWTEAQRAFFNAYRREPSNPDYAYNLAVTLDHVQQYQLAIDYYDLALEMAGQSSAVFDQGSVAARITVLSGLIHSR